jgi:heptaprenyl diphosphate synthase
MHNVGQIGAASVMLGTNVVTYYLPFLLLSGTIAGVVVGVASAVLIKKVDLDKITKTSRRR